MDRPVNHYGDAEWEELEVEEPDLILASALTSKVRGKIPNS